MKPLEFDFALWESLYIFKRDGPYLWIHKSKRSHTQKTRSSRRTMRAPMAFRPIMCPCRWSSSVGYSYGIIMLSYSTMMIMPIAITIMIKIAANGGCLNKNYTAIMTFCLMLFLLWSLQLWCFKFDLSISAECRLGLASVHTCKIPHGLLFMNPYSTHSYPEFLVTAGDFSSSYGVMYFFFFLTRALTVCHFSFRFRNAGEARFLWALRGVEKEKMLSQKTDFKLLWF